MDSIVRPTSLNYIHDITTERLSTYGTPHEQSHWTITTVPGTTFDSFILSSDGSVWGNFGINGQVFLPSEALK